MNKMIKQNKKRNGFILLLLVVAGVLSALMIAILVFSSVSAVEITSTLFKPVNSSMIPAGAERIESSIGASDYYYGNNVFFREGNPNDGDCLMGEYSSFGFGLNNGSSYIDLTDGRYGSMAVLDGGFAFVTSRRAENKIPLIELTENAFVRDNQYLIQTDNFFVYLTPTTLFTNSSTKSSPAQIDTYALYYLNDTNKYYLQFLIFDNLGKSAKLIINDKNEILLLDRNQTIDTNGNIISGPQNAAITKNSANYGLPIEWSDINNKWISIADVR